MRVANMRGQRCHTSPYDETPVYARDPLDDSLHHAGSMPVEYILSVVGDNSVTRIKRRPLQCCWCPLRLPSVILLETHMLLLHPHVFVQVFALFPAILSSDIDHTNRLVCIAIFKPTTLIFARNCAFEAFCKRPGARVASHSRPKPAYFT